MLLIGVEPMKNNQNKTMKKVKLFEQFVTEKKVDYQVYHDSYAEAITAALEYAKASGYEVDEDDVWNEISMGPKRPGDGFTNRITITLHKNGKEQKKALQISVYGMGNRYELNAYIS
jgi:hypothetical protein